MRSPVRILTLGCCLVVGAALADGEGAACSQAETVTPLATETASAGYIANISNRKDSIRSTSNRMLTKAIESASTSGEPRRIVFKSIPELSKKSTSDDAMCRRQEAETKTKPLVFDDKRFASADELTDWIMEFTRGKGADGRSLYEQCPGECSPQYTWWIDPKGSDLLVRARVVCGMPRDRSGDKYHLSTALTEICPAEK